MCVYVCVCLCVCVCVCMCVCVCVCVWSSCVISCQDTITRERISLEPSEEKHIGDHTRSHKLLHCWDMSYYTVIKSANIHWQCRRSSSENKAQVRCQMIHSYFRKKNHESLSHLRACMIEPRCYWTLIFKGIVMVSLGLGYDNETDRAWKDCKHRNNQ